MASLVDSYVGTKDEVSYGTTIVPDKFTEFLSEGISGKYDRIESEGLRAGANVLRTDRWAVNAKGAEGDLKFEVMDTGFDLFLKHMFGSSTAGTPTGGFTTYTAILADLAGKSFGLEVGRVTSGGTVTPFKYNGGKVKSWEISNAVDGVLQASLDLDFAAEVISGGAALTPVYPAFATQLLTFTSGVVTIGGVATAVSDVSLKGDNALKTDRYALRGVNSTTKREPLTEGLRAITFDAKCEFESTAHITKVSSLTTAGATTTLALQWDSPQGGQLLVTIPIARLDEAPVNVDGAKVLEQSVTGKVLSDGTAAPITVAYKAKTT